MGLVAVLASWRPAHSNPLGFGGVGHRAERRGAGVRTPERMAATLLPTLSPPVSRAAAAFLLRRAPLKPSHYVHPPSTLRRLLISSYPAIPAMCPLSTMSSTTAARAVPVRRDLLMLGIETSCDDTAAAVVLV